MKKLIKSLILSLFIFTTCFIGGKINNVEVVDIGFCEPNLVTAIPSSYDLRDHIYIEVENQHNFGICYTFASLTSLETYLALHYGEYYDFSEMHFAASLYMQDDYHSSIESALVSGGNFTHFTLYTQKDKSLVLEQEMPIKNYLSLSSSNRETRVRTDFNNINNNFYSIAKVNDTKSYPEFIGNKANYNQLELREFRNQIKRHLMTYGSLTANIHTATGGFNNNTINYRVVNDNLVRDENTINQSIDHMISIVGWDDNYDANGAWANKGAYLCLNSWGDNFGLDGYFYVSYDDYFIESDINGITNATLSTTSNKISTITNYQNKTSIYPYTFNSGNADVFIANIFDTSSNIGEQITSIDHFVIGSSSKFYIKFFNTYADAIQGINSVTTLLHTTKVDSFTLYDRYSLSSPITITNNYMVVASETVNTYKMNSLAGYSSLNLGIPKTYYYQNKGIGNFHTNTDIWSPANPTGLSHNIPVILHTNKQYITVQPIECVDEYFIDSKYIQNNVMYPKRKVNFVIDNTTLTDTDINNVTITKLYEGNFANVTAGFNIVKLSSNSLSIELKSLDNINYNSTKNNYLITIPCGDNVVHRIVSIVNNVVVYNINYELNGGLAPSNPTTYTNTHTYITLNSPTKDGYEFVGWYTDEGLTQKFDSSKLPYTNLTLYAKYQIEPPTIIYKSDDVSVVYSKGFTTTISISATHQSVNMYNTLSYQWFMRKNLADPFTPVVGETSPSLTLTDVSQSGFYACEVTLNMEDGTSTVLAPSQSNVIVVDIKPFVYDMSQVRWNYSNKLCYNGKIQTVELINLPNGVTASYTNNSFTNIGCYTATATLIYDDMGGNAYSPDINNLEWEIRKANLKITIEDIITTTNMSDEDVISLCTCTIESEFFPDNVITHQDKIEYLGLQFELHSTANTNIFIITATIDNFNFYNTSITSAKYRVIISSLTSGDITSTSEKGFVKDCEFNTSTYNKDETTLNLIKENNLNVVLGYNLTYSYLDTEATVNIPITCDLILKGLSVYMLKDGNLTKLDTTITSNSLSFNTTEQDAIYLIVSQSSELSNKQILMVILIISIFASLSIGAIFTKKNN